MHKEGFKVDQRHCLSLLIREGGSTELLSLLLAVHYTGGKRLLHAFAMHSTPSTAGHHAA
eukprot:1154560-Pelagomonas_calceolata.AAC.6